MQARVRVDASRSTPFNPMIFGQFLEHFHRQVYGGAFEPGSPLSDGRGFRKDVIAALRELRVPIVRWPGGCFVSAYHWKDGVGERVSVFDKAWLVEEPNTFGTDEFILWCREIGAEPYICTNAGTGTSEEMSDWVEYCNATVGKFARLRRENGHAEPFGVKFWSVGNENWGGHEIGAKKPAEWAPFVAESAKMMLRVDPSLRLSAAALSDPNWTLPLLREAGHYLSYISLHYYWDSLHSANNPSDYPTCMARTGGPDAELEAGKKLLQETKLAGRVSIAFDEWNLRGWHHPWKGNAIFGDVAARDKNDIHSTYTMADALFSGCFLNACLRHADTTGMACMAPVINARGPLFVHPKGIVRRTTFHVLRMYADLAAPNVAASSCECDPYEHAGQSVPVVDAVATADAGAKTLSLALINKHPSEEIAVEVELNGSAAAGTVDAEVLAADSPDAYNDIDRPDRVAPVRRTLTLRGGRTVLPPHSLTVCRWTK